MIYYEDKELLVRDMVQSDARIITEEEIAQGWNQTTEKYEMRLQHQSEGIAISLVAEYKGMKVNVTETTVNIVVNKAPGKLVMA